MSLLLTVSLGEKLSNGINIYREATGLMYQNRLWSRIRATIHIQRSTLYPSRIPPLGMLFPTSSKILCFPRRQLAHECCQNSALPPVRYYACPENPPGLGVHSATPRLGSLRHAGRQASTLNQRASKSLGGRESLTTHTARRWASGQTVKTSHDERQSATALMTVT